MLVYLSEVCVCYPVVLLASMLLSPFRAGYNAVETGAAPVTQALVYTLKSRYGSCNNRHGSSMCSTLVDISHFCFLLIKHIGASSGHSTLSFPSGLRYAQDNSI